MRVPVEKTRHSAWQHEERYFRIPHLKETEFLLVKRISNVLPNCTITGVKSGLAK